MTGTIAAIWGGLLAVVSFAVVPVVLAYLQRGLDAARQIERFTADILAGGVGIARNTADVAALQETIAAAPLLIERAGGVVSHLDAIRVRLGGNGADAAPPELEIEP